jgi:hypothetical protein
MVILEKPEVVLMVEVDLFLKMVVTLILFHQIMVPLVLEAHHLGLAAPMEMVAEEELLQVAVASLRMED